MTEPLIHVYREKDQRATRYKHNAGFIIRNKSRKLILCFNCNKKRWAKYLVVHSYYDGDRFFCTPRKGCSQ